MLIMVKSYLFFLFFFLFFFVFYNFIIEQLLISILYSWIYIRETKNHSLTMHPKSRGNGDYVVVAFNNFPLISL